MRAVKGESSGGPSHSSAFPRIWVPSGENRDLRQLLWHRHRMVQMRTRLMNQLQAVALNEELRRKKGLWREAGRKQLESFRLAPWASRRRRDLLELLDRLNPTIAELSQAIEQEVEKCPEAQRLRTHPGVGSLTALAFVLIVGSAERCQCGKQIASYLGLVPSEESSGDRRRLEHITKQGDRIKCSIDIVGMSNLVTFLEHTEEYRRDLRRVEYGDERDPNMRAFLEKIAPMNNIVKIKKPMLVVAGKNDPRVPVSESDQIVEGLKKQGTPVWYILAKDEGHGFQKKANQDYEFYSDIVFLQEYLLK
jgi:Prolyl oligopeptidase family/Transposase IS116/IS110/IS902 family